MLPTHSSFQRISLAPWKTAWVIFRAVRTYIPLYANERPPATGKSRLIDPRSCLLAQPNLQIWWNIAAACVWLYDVSVFGPVEDSRFTAFLDMSLFFAVCLSAVSCRPVVLSSSPLLLGSLCSLGLKERVRQYDGTTHPRESTPRLPRIVRALKCIPNPPAAALRCAASELRRTVGSYSSRSLFGWMAKAGLNVENAASDTSETSHISIFHRRAGRLIYTTARPDWSSCTSQTKSACSWHGEASSASVCRVVLHRQT